MFTAQGIKALKPTKKKQEIMEGRGFGIRVQPSGAKTWLYRYRFAGKLKRMALGAYPAVSLSEARQRYLAAQAKHREGIDPQASADTVGELADLYMTRQSKPTKKSWQQDARMLKRDVIPMIGSMKLEKVRKRDVLRVIDAVNDRGAPILANRTLGLIKTIFAYGVDRDLIETSPVFFMKRPNKEHSRDVVLTDQQMHDLMTCRIIQSSDVMRIMALTGQRVGEVCQMRYADLEPDVWTIPREFVKSDRVHLVPLLPAAWEIIDRQTSPNEWVFGRPGGHLKALSPTERCRRLDLGFRPHDIRRSVATGLARLGVQRVVISKLLNHSDASVTGVYDRHEYWDERKAGLEAWAQHLVELQK